MLGLEWLLVTRAQLDHARHVGFVEGGQDRRGLLGLDQALGDPLPEPAHPLAGLAGADLARVRPGGRTAVGRLAGGGWIASPSGARAGSGPAGCDTAGRGDSRKLRRPLW